MKKILIANRGEIALRIMRSARELHIPTVAVFSEADRKALHVQYADEAVYIGEAPAAASYLNIENILNACKKTKADAVHPGYGFLSENPEFARALQREGITLIGPSAEAMELMGNKLSAKAAALEYGIPLVPGTTKAIDTVEEALTQAQAIGFPILIKAAAGGGGKGMRIVNDPLQFKEQLSLAISEATAAFGDGAVFMERYIASPKHIEIQVLSDQHGNFVHLFERECSIQRRHQKVIEEAPSAVLTPDLRKKMGQYAIQVAQSCQYTGAGTVEFIMDEQMNFYFLEMNTRLQVEHPVTEMITGIDIVKEQIRIAEGKALTFKQEDLKMNGHSIELRIYAEDPATDFLPDIGTLHSYRIPEGPGIRIDNSYTQGMEIPVYYDPMIAKLITWGKDRNEAISRMVRAIDEYEITGIRSTLPFGRFVMQHQAFQSGKFDTHFVNKHFSSEKLIREDKDEMKIAALFAKQFFAKPLSEKQEQAVQRHESNWKKNRL